MRTQIAPQQRARTGVLWIHSAPLALQPHLTWAVARLTLADGTKPGRAMWRTRKQGSSQLGQSQSTLLCAEFEWTAPLSDAEALVDDLSRWPHITFELAIDAPEDFVGATGLRFLHTPELGTYSATTDDAGNILLNEERIRGIMATPGAGAETSLADALDEALGGPWDRAIEPLRPGTAGFDDDYSLTIEPTPPGTKPAPQLAPAFHGADFSSENVVVLHPRRAVM